MLYGTLSKIYDSDFSGQDVHFTLLAASCHPRRTPRADFVTFYGHLMQTKAPIEIRKTSKNSLRITWDTATTREISGEVLRRACPCAECRAERGDSSHAAPLTPKKTSLLRVVDHSLEKSTALQSVWSVGNYALGVRFEDGHDSGIYTFDLLASLGGGSDHERENKEISQQTEIG